MIVLTGPGRSGTSFLARLYQELGFDPVEGGGGWESSINGGLEDIEVGRVNLEIIRALGMQSAPSELRRLVREVLLPTPGSGGPGVNATADHSPRGGNGLASARRLRELILEKALGQQLRLLQWSDVEAVTERYGERLREMAAGRAVVKDPQFCQTLRIWAASQAPIEQVVVSARDTTATATGLLKTGHLPGWAASNAPNHVAYRLGLLVTALHDFRLQHVILRFPDFLQKPEELFEALRFPQPVERDRFLEVFGSIADPALVHSWR